MTKLYAVKIGRQPGIYMTWAEAEVQVSGFSGAQYKSFKSAEEAVAYMTGTAPVTPVTPAAPVIPTTPVAPVGIEIYVDGSYRMGSYAWAYVVVDNGQVIYQDSGVGTNADAAALNNVAGELAAAMRGAQWAAKNDVDVAVTIIHDYEGVAAWATGAWKAKNQFTQAYTQYMQNKNVSFKQIKGHSGNKFNELADKLAYSKLPPTM